jgi:hypothetical protein
MIDALYTLATTFVMLLLAVRLSHAQDEIRQLRGDASQRATAEYLAYRQGVVLSLACLLAGLAAASWYTPRSDKRAGE